MTVVERLWIVHECLQSKHPEKNVVVGFGKVRGQDKLQQELR